MSLVRKILNRFWPRDPCEGGQRVHLAIFGKHPGWDDHIDGLGLDSPRLVEVKRLIYTQGIGGNVDSGRWDRLDASHRLDEFAHLFLWRFPRDLVAGRIWSSRDGKGRGHYPMIACGQCCDVPAGWVLDHVLPILEEVEAACVATRLAQDVRSALQAARDRLRLLAAEEAPRIPNRRPAEGEGPASGSDSADIAALLDRPEMGPNHEGFHRILYQLQAACGAANERSFLIRVPAGDALPPQAARRWLTLLETLVHAEIPVLLVIPLKGDWMDIILGSEVTVLDVFAMRTRPASIPLTTDIPYNLDADFVRQAQRMTEDLMQGRSAHAQVRPDFPITSDHCQT